MWNASEGLALNVSICTQMDLASYQTLKQMKFMVPGSNRYQNVAVGLIFTLEVGSNSSYSLSVFTLHV